MEYDLYHDESKEAGYWHGILLIPANSREFLLQELGRIRENIRYDETVTLKGLNKRSGKQFNCVRAWLTIGSCALVQQMNSGPVPYYTGKIDVDNKGRRRYELARFHHAIGAKLIIFRVPDDHKSLDSTFFPDHASKIETTLRMGLKGGMHLLGSSDAPVCIRSFHFDGYEHHGRHLDLTRIVGRITGLREYASFAKNMIADDRTSDHKREGSQSFDDCQFLQLTDLFVGAFRTVLGECKNQCQKEVSYPAEQLVARWKEGPARMRRSRFHKGFCISQCRLENSQWKFEDVSLKQNQFQMQIFQSQ